MSTKLGSITIRLIRSFEYRNFKNLILHDVDTSMSIGQLMELVQKKIETTPGYKLFQKNNFDCMKIFMFPHGAKTSNLIVNLDHEEWIMSDLEKSLADYGIIDETEISFFNRELYNTYRNDPQVKW